MQRHTFEISLQFRGPDHYNISQHEIESSGQTSRQRQCNGEQGAVLVRADTVNSNHVLEQTASSLLLWIQAPFLAVDETLQTRVKAGNAKIRHGQEGHWRQHPLLEVANTSLRSVAAVNDHRIQVSR